MIYKVALLIDWDNIRYWIFKNKDLLRRDTPRFSYLEHTTKLPAFFLEFLEKEEKPYRIFFYLSEGYRSKAKDPDGREIDFSKKEEVKTMDRFIHRLSVQDLVAIRKGRTALRGWINVRDNRSGQKYVPIFVQKKVDILLGLDITHLTYNRLVDRILIFSYDTDLQPALKTARIGGVQVILPFFKEMKWEDIPLELKAHSDFIRIRSYHEICCKLLKNA